MQIRPATALDRDAIHRVHWSAFAEDERALVAELAVELMDEQVVPPVLSLVAHDEGRVVGHVAFSPVSVEGEGGFQGYLLGPLGVLPELQKRRVGSSLVERGIEQLTQAGVDVILVYGDPKYYGRFGFTVEAAGRYVPPYELQYPFGWQAIALKDVGGGGTQPIKIECVQCLCDPALW